jgi:hypothetical protein
MKRQYEEEFSRILDELIKVDKFVYDEGFRLRGIAIKNADGDGFYSIGDILLNIDKYLGNIKTDLENLWLRVEREEKNNDK